MTAFMRMDEVENREVIYFAPAPIYDCHIVPYLPTKSLTVPTNTDSHQPAANSHISSAASSLASSSAEVESSGKGC